MFIPRVARTARVPADEVDPESALAAATEMIAKMAAVLSVGEPFLSLTPSSA
jgi:hypothetical protein